MPKKNTVLARIVATTKNDDSKKRLREELRQRKRKERSQRINRVAGKLTTRYEKQRHKEQENGGRKKPFARKDRPEKPRVRKLIAYDLETTSIKKGTPKPVYITAYGEDFHISGAIKDIEHLCDILVNRFLTEENAGCRYVAWNGNKFDVYFIGAALLYDDSFIIRPYLTKGKNLRGMKVMKKGDEKLSWEFLDGMSMTGIQKPLSDFLKIFAPEYLKLDAPDWEKETFNPKNKKHVDYAERDSEGLYHALVRAQSITMEHFRLPLQPTIGNLGIKAFQAHIPGNVLIYEPPYSAVTVIREFAMRGGYCFRAKKYEGKVWKYDINQAYAAAMREAWLPAGRCIYTKGEHPYATCAVYRIEAVHSANKVPFYYTEIIPGEKGKLDGKRLFAVDRIGDTWITSIELKQLKKEGWKVKVKEGWFWEDAFRMDEYVNKLERLRVNAPGGSKSAQGEMMKAIGNNSYGKTVERLEGIELVLANEAPEGFYNYQCEDDAIQHIWFRFAKPTLREYHQPQLGAFITAHVRMVLRRAILINPDGWLYADTDCVIFDSPVDLPIDPSRYGWWKVECEGKEYRIITKKVYADFGANEKHAKGLNIRRLTDEDFVRWYNGEPPRQTQIQRQNFLKCMTGAEMFVELIKFGERKIGQKIA